MAVEFLALTPASNSTIAADEFLTFDLRTPVADAFTTVLVAVEFDALQDLREVVFAGNPGIGNALMSARWLGSTVSSVTDAGYVRYQFRIRPNPLWPASPRLIVYAFAASGAGINVAPSQGNWVVASEQLPETPAQPAPMPPLFGSAVACASVWFDQAHFLRTLENSYPEDYFEGIRTNGGYEVFQANASVAERVSLAISRMECCAFLFSAHGGSKATGSVEFYREDASSGAITILPGSRIKTANGRKFVTTTAATFGDVDLGPHAVNVEAVAFGYEYNVPGQIITAGGEMLEGSIVLIDRLVTQDYVIDPNLNVRQPGSTSGGAADCLDGLGEDLNIPRLPGEADDAYRVRILETPDTVSPAAIQRGVNKILAPYGSSVCLREVGGYLFRGFFYDAGASTDAVQNPAVNFAWDTNAATRPEDRFKVWLSHFEMRAFMMLGVPSVQQVAPWGMAYDGSSADLNPLANAWDTESDSGSGAFDGEQATLRSSLYQSIYAVVDAKRAGGVSFDLYLEDIGCF
jgi:hypothetical protein